MRTVLPPLVYIDKSNPNDNAYYQFNYRINKMNSLKFNIFDEFSLNQVGQDQIPFKPSVQRKSSLSLSENSGTEETVTMNIR